MQEFIQAWQPTGALVSAFLPEIILAAGALLVLALDVWCSKKRPAVGFTATCGVLLVAALFSVAQLVCPRLAALASGTAGSIFGMTAPFFASFALFFIGCAFLTTLVARTVRERAEFSAPITNHLILVATAAAAALLKSTNFIAFFVLLETLTVTLYALVGSYRTSVASLEAGVKYLIAGGVSGALMLFGVVLLYGASALAGAPAPWAPDALGYGSVFALLNQDPTNAVALAGVALTLCGVLFKFGVFPMQFWIPDTYQGAPTHVTFFLATLSKGVGFGMTGVFLVVFAPVFDVLFPVLLVLTLISMVYANVTALGQRKVKRLLGLSGVSHASYMMLGMLAFGKILQGGVSASSPDSMLFALALYLVFYVLSLYPIFSVMARVPAGAGDEALQDVNDFRGLAKRSPVLAGAVVSGLASLAGIPPTVGFIAKLGILWIVFSAGLYVPAAIMLACVVASVYYYFVWIRSAFATEEADSAPALSCPGVASRISLVFFTALTVLGCLVYFAAIAL